MNLDNLNLVEISHSEMNEVEGGLLIPLTWLVAGAVIGGVFGLGVYNGYNS
jgi:hypothetical protein